MKPFAYKFKYLQYHPGSYGYECRLIREDIDFSIAFDLRDGLFYNASKRPTNLPLEDWYKKTNSSLCIALHSYVKSQLPRRKAKQVFKTIYGYGSWISWLWQNNWDLMPRSLDDAKPVIMDFLDFVAGQEETTPILTTKD